MTIAAGIVLPEAEIAEICRRYKVRELSLFGSALRGKIGPDSDIDLLVDFLPDAEVSLFRHAAAEREFSDLLGRRVDLVSKRALRAALRDQLLSQARLSTQRDLRYLLDDILTAATAIADFAVERDSESFRINRLVQSAITPQLMIIGEAAGHVSTELRGRYYTLPWVEMKGLRSILVHNYFGTDWEEVWRTVLYDVPSVKREVIEVLRIEFPE
jgi:uncharacterized protein